jgi:hypothetical protein
MKHTKAEMRKAHKILQSENLKGRDHLGELKTGSGSGLLQM